MHIGTMKKLKPLLLDARTSYETAPQHCPESRVVGYAAIAYVSEKTAAVYNTQNAVDSETSINQGISDNDKKILLKLARESLDASVRGKRFRYSPESFSEMLKEKRGCFVTLTKNGDLRGCIGYIEPIKPLYQAVVENAQNAALSDPRFPVVTPDELEAITVEVSVLTRPEPLLYSSPKDLLDKLKVGIDGVILEKGRYHSTFLPQVWEQLPDKRTFLEHLAVKGGMSRDGWETANVKTYKAIHFNE